MVICLQCKLHFTSDKLGEIISECGWMHFFCCEECRDTYLYRQPTNLRCSREGCNNRVPEQNRMLCLECHQNESNIGERVAFFLDASRRADWERRDEAIKLRLNEKVRVYSAQHMTQEELRALVPSLKEEAQWTGARTCEGFSTLTITRLLS